MKLLQHPFAIPVSILLLAFALRCVTLDTRPLWYDDAFSVFLSERGVASIVSGTAVDTDPPGYYLLLSGWMNLVGQTPAAMRVLGLMLSVLIVALTYALGKRAFGAAVGNWAALLVALMPFQIYHAQELRMYTLFGLGLCLYFYGVLDLSSSPYRRFPIRPLVLIGVGTVLALWAQNLAFATFLAGHVYLILRALRDKGIWRKEMQLLAAQVAAGIFYIPWLFYLPTQLAKVTRSFYTEVPGFLEVLQAQMVLTAYLPLPPWLTAIALFVVVAVPVLAIWYLIKLARRERLPALGVVVAFAVVPPLVLFVMSYLMRPIFVPRGLVVVPIAFALLLGVPAARAPRVLQMGMAAFAFLVAALLLPFYYMGYGEWRRADYAAADAFLRAQMKKGDAVVHDNKLSYFPMHLYDRELTQVFLADPPQSDNDTLAPASQAAIELYPTEFETAVGGHARVWFLVYRTALDEADEEGVPHGNLARLDGRYQRVQETNYGDLVVVLYSTR